MNILSSMYSYLEEERFDELKQYYEERLLPDGRKLATEDNFIGKLSNMKIMELKGLLYTKVLNAFDSKLHVTVDIPEPVAIINMNIPDLVRILGIFLDNAIEAALQTSEKELSIGILCSEKYDYIRIANSSLPVTNITELFKDGYSEKDNHLGVGLHEVETLLNKHPEVLLNAEYKDGNFILLLQLCRISS